MPPLQGSSEELLVPGDYAPISWCPFGGSGVSRQNNGFVGVGRWQIRAAHATITVRVSHRLTPTNTNIDAQPHERGTSQGDSAPEVPPTFRKAALRAATTIQTWIKRGRTFVRPLPIKQTVGRVVSDSVPESRSESGHYNTDVDRKRAHVCASLVTKQTVIECRRPSCR